MFAFDPPSHLPLLPDVAACYAERCQELFELTKAMAANNQEIVLKQNLEKWILDWVEQPLVRLDNDRPSDHFASQDGFSEVEYYLREVVRSWV